MKNIPGSRILLFLLLAVLCALAVAAQPVLAQDEPTIVKDSVRVELAPHQEEWLPQLYFRVNGPIASGSQLYVEYAVPGKPWAKSDCPTEVVEKGHWWQFECRTDRHGGQGPEVYSHLSGLVGFSIRLRNELLGTNATLFAGKMKVLKVLCSHTSKSVCYYVDEDWRIPIGYVYIQHTEGAWEPPTVHAKLWFRGNPEGV